MCCCVGRERMVSATPVCVDAPLNNSPSPSYQARAGRPYWSILLDAFPASPTTQPTLRTSSVRKRKEKKLSAEHPCTAPLPAQKPLQIPFSQYPATTPVASDASLSLGGGTILPTSVVRKNSRAAPLIGEELGHFPPSLAALGLLSH